VGQPSLGFNSRLRESMLRFLQPVHEELRRRKLALLFQVAGEYLRGRLLDVGGGRGIVGEFAPLYSRFAEVVIVNLEPVSLPAAFHAKVQTIVADGCALPFRNASFDWVFSNAVIEHVGGGTRQSLFAQEIRRVATRGYFVATPDLYFPIDPHTYLPFYQFLPEALQRRVIPFCPGFLRRHEEIHMLSARSMRSLFPDARVERTGFRLWPNSLVACHMAD